jgi:hypothetical protein
VPSPGVLGLFAIIARYVHYPGQIRRNRLEGHSRRHGIPRGHHPLPCLGSLLADGTSGVVGRQLSEAVPMYGVAAGHLMGGAPRTEQEFLTHWAVRLVLAALAVVIEVQALVDAHATIVTVPKVLRPAHATESAVTAVVRLLVVRHPQVTDVAVVLSKLDSAVDTIVPANHPEENQRKIKHSEKENK